MKPNSPQLGKCSERDLELLSGYLDNQLSAPEQAHLEQRLNIEPMLQNELEELRATVQTLQELAPIALPRSFILNLDTVQPKKPFLSFLPIPKIHLAGAMAVLLVAFALTTLYALNQPHTDTVQTIALNLAPQQDEKAIDQGLATGSIEESHQQPAAHSMEESDEPQESRAYATQDIAQISRETTSNYSHETDNAALSIAATPSPIAIVTTVEEHAASSPQAPQDAPIPPPNQPYISQAHTEAYPPTAPRIQTTQQQQLPPPMPAEAEDEVDADTQPTEESDTADDTIAIAEDDTGDDTADDTIAIAKDEHEHEDNTDDDTADDTIAIAEDEHNKALSDDTDIQTDPTPLATSASAEMDMPLSDPSQATQSAIIAQQTPSNTLNTPTLFAITVVVITFALGSWLILRHRNR